MPKVPTRMTDPLEGVYLQIYPSTLVNASRMLKIAQSVQARFGFLRTELVGYAAPGLEAREQVGDEVHIVRVGGKRSPTRFGRLMRHFLWQPRVYRHYRKQRLSVVAAHNVWVLILAWLLCRKTGASLVYNAHELETETESMQGAKQQAAKVIESRIIGSCALVSVVNSPIANWYASTYGITAPVIVRNIPRDRPTDVGLRRLLGIAEHEMLYIHTGHLVGGRNIPLILEAFSRSPHHVVFLGDGHLRGGVLEASRSLPNVHWIPPVEPDLVVSYVREADVGLCLMSYPLSSPNKLFESLAAGVPALCSDLVVAREVLGPLAGDWILDDPQRQLSAALARISKADIEVFKSRWQANLSWEDEVEPLLVAYGAVTAMSGGRRVGRARSN